ncbi:MAG: putative dsRNA-binding protein [Deinococcota bacterium]|jgi:hypothetical protein|nr:putative dsRNA-binding protein [Deinococcota bacterium]
MKEAKGVLIERCRALGLGKPQFDTNSSGPAHERVFTAEVSIRGDVRGRAQAKTKREAERQASIAALEALDTPAKVAAVPSAAGEFQGPWPLFPELLAASLSVANSRVETHLQGQEAVAKVKDLALMLYKESLESLGEIVEADED